MSLMASLIAGLLLQTSPVQDRTHDLRDQSTRVTIVEVGPRPPAFSGGVITATRILARADDGTTKAYHQIFLSEEDPLPTVGARCTLRHHTGGVGIASGEERARPAEVISDFECDPPYSPTAVFEDVLVLNRGDNIRVFGSGIIWVVLPVKGQLRDGRDQFFYITVGEPGMPAPPVSSRCRFEAQREDWIDGMATGENDLPRREDYAGQMPPTVQIWSLKRFDCTINSDSPVIVPPDAPAVFS